jgi:hypothetical protein
MAEERQDMPTGEPQAEKSEKAKTSPLYDFLDHQRKAADEACKAFESLIPPDFRTHSRAAREEFLLSFKVLVEGMAKLVDEELNRMRSTPSSGSGPSTTGKTKVRVEVN